MFQSFDIHATIFNRINKYDYFMISSGTSQFSMPYIWKKSMKAEIDTDFLYRWYTSAKGFQSASAAIKVYEDFISSEEKPFIKNDRTVCMTIGGSGAGSLVFDFLQKNYKKCNVFLVGMNYSLYERLARNKGFEVYEIIAKYSQRCIPSIEDFSDIEIEKKDKGIKNVFIFSNPNNPSGECYDLEEFSKIVSYIKEKNGFIILDQVCNLVISTIQLPLLQQVITNYNYWKECIVVNSFSKTDSIAGIRIGYVYGHKKVIKEIEEFIVNSIMNPPTFPMFPIVLVCMFRCIYLSEHHYKNNKKRTYFSRLFRHLFYMTASIVPPSMQKFANCVFDNIDFYYEQYVNEVLENEKTIYKNYNATLNILKPYIKSISKMKGGFNFCVWFNKAFRYHELELIEKMLHKTGVALLTESSFCLHPNENNQFFIRFSLACEEDGYLSALLRMRDFFESQEVFYDKY